MRSEPLDPEPEGICIGHVCIGLPGRGYGVVIASCIGDYLGHLPTSGVVSPPEVWSVLRVAWLSYATTLVPSHHTVHSQALDPQPECVGIGHVMVGLLGGGYILL